MAASHYYFDNVTLLITHYNRSNSLKRLLLTFKEQNCNFKNVVVSDDGSMPEHLEVVKDLEKEFRFQLVSTYKNKGLGNNINKGQDVVTTEYTLYVQEDFIPTSIFANHFKDALNIMEKENQWDIARFYAYYAYPYLKPHSRGFSEMVFNRWNVKTGKFHYYSDHPHLRRGNFLEKFGRYVEGKSPSKTEYLKCVDFIKQKGKGLFFDNYNNLFIQVNSRDEPSTWQQKTWKTSSSPITTFIRGVYRQLKYNYDINF